MNLAEGTIKIHAAAAYRLLQLNSRLDALRSAQQPGLITLAREGRNGA